MSHGPNLYYFTICVCLWTVFQFDWRDTLTWLRAHVVLTLCRGVYLTNVTWTRSFAVISESDGSDICGFGENIVQCGNESSTSTSLSSFVILRQVNDDFCHEIESVFSYVLLFNIALPVILKKTWILEENRVHSLVTLIFLFIEFINHSVLHLLKKTDSNILASHAYTV